MSPTVSGMVSSTTFCICRTILTGNWELFIPNESNLWCKISNFQLNHSMLLTFDSQITIFTYSPRLSFGQLTTWCHALSVPFFGENYFISSSVRFTAGKAAEGHDVAKSWSGRWTRLFCQPCIEPFSVWVSSTVKKILSQTLFNVVFLLHSSICYVLFLWIATRQGLSCSFNKFGIIEYINTVTRRNTQEVSRMYG